MNLAENASPGWRKSSCVRKLNTCHDANELKAS